MCLFSAWAALLVLLVGADDDTADRKQKALSVFTVVKFPNTVCLSSTTGRNGTCYTNSECAAKGGSASGSCASGFGACCIFEKSCGGGSIAENCTYFTSSSLTKGSSCSLTICKCSSDICQLRLDYETFVLSNPVTITTITVGPPAAEAGSATRIGNCDTDSFGVTVPGGKSPPAICGTNTGQHMYIPASSTGCNILTANIGSGSTATTSAFTIKVSQIECSSKRLAPTGCLQYFTGDSGTAANGDAIQTYNYNSGGGVLLANQDYTACIRDNRAYCAICYYTPATITGFGMSIPNGIVAATNVDTNCGSPGLSAFTSGGGYDHVLIPGGQCDSPVGGIVVAANFLNDRYCGTNLNCMNGIASAQGSITGTVCTNQKPFRIGVQSDGLEYINPAPLGEALAANNFGFEMNYYMKTTCLTRPPQ